MLIKLFFKILKIISHTAVLLTLCISLLITNFLTLTSSTVHDALYDVLDRMHVTKNFSDTPSKRTAQLRKQKQSLKDKNHALIEKSKQRTTKIKGITSKIAKRTVRNVGVNVASVPLEAIPWVGIASVVGVTAMDVKDGCDTMKDINSLMKDMELEQDPGKNKVCGYSIPSAADLVNKMKEKVSITKEGYANFQDKLGGTIDTAKENILEKWRNAGEVVSGTAHDVFH